MFEKVCCSLLAEADKFALKNVDSGGGPFAAIVAVYDPVSCECVRIGKPSVNAVLDTGIPSAHAEDQWFLPRKNMRDLVQVLSKWKQKGREPQVIFASSGQSCPSCLTKEEILARYLKKSELVPYSNFIVAYGATFENSARIAGFNDLPYVQDLVRFQQLPLSTTSMVKYRVAKVGDIPVDVAQLFKQASGQLAVVARGNEILAVGEDSRYGCDIISTAEVSAIRDACRMQKKDGIEQPWILGDINHINPSSEKMATLYTTADNGPLKRSAMGRRQLDCECNRGKRRHWREGIARCDEYHAL